MKICKKCHSEIPKESVFCPYCGKAYKKKYSKYLMGGVIFLFLVGGILLGSSFLKKDKKEEGSYSYTASSHLSNSVYNDKGQLRFLNATFSDEKINDEQDVLKALENIKEETGLQNPSQELLLTSKETVNEITYYRFQQVYNGLKVIDQNVIVSVSKDKQILGYTGNFLSDIKVDTTPKKSQEEIKEIAINYLGNEAKVYANDLAIWADSSASSLIYQVVVYNDAKALELLMDANNGNILEENDLLNMNAFSYTDTGIDNKSYTISLESYYDDILLQNCYRFYDTERKIAIYDYNKVGNALAFFISNIPFQSSITVDMENGKIKDKDELIENAITAMANFETIYDYYKNVLGRDSYDNKGSAIRINLGVTAQTFTNKDLNNASWNRITKQMYIGNYKGKSLADSLDVLGHEFTHGVIQFISNFAASPKKEDYNKAFEAGALNEGYADILGALIEGKNWVSPENNQTARDATNPLKYNHPDTKGGKYYIPDGYLSSSVSLEDFLKNNNIETVKKYDNGGVHNNSNVVSHAAYLMYDAGAFQSREEMAKVWYQSLFYLTSYASFEDCAHAVIKSAQTLGLSDDAIIKITKAFHDTNMLEKKTSTLSGIIKNGDTPLSDAEVKIYSYSKDTMLSGVLTKEEGKYTFEIEEGMYKVQVSKEGYETFEKIIHVSGDTTLDISLAKENNEGLLNECKTDKCYKLTIYSLVNNSANRLEETTEVCYVSEGTYLNPNTIVNIINKTLNGNYVSYKDKTFYLTMGGITTDFALYYKGTDTKFDLDKPVTEDAEIEMKAFNGSLDNDTITNIEDFLKKNGR